MRISDWSSDVCSSDLRPIIGTSEHNQVVVTLGISLILQNVALVVFSADLRTIPSAFSSSKFYIGDVLIRSTAAVACVISIAVCLVLYLFLMTTALPRSLRATAADAAAAHLYIGSPSTRRRR